MFRRETTFNAHTETVRPNR